MQLLSKHIDLILNADFPKAHLTIMLKKRYRRIFNQIFKQTSFLDKYSNVSLRERLFCIKNNLSDRPLCKKCQKQHVSNFNIHINTYKKWCSPTCQASDNDCIAKSKATRKQKYGNENYSGVEKSRQTRFSKNNGKWHSADFSSQVKAAKLKRYGDENYTNVSKYAETYQQHKHDDPNFVRHKIERIKQTKATKWGDPNWNNREKFKSTLNAFSDEQREHILTKRKNTCLNRYGVDSVAKLDATKQKVHDTIAKQPEFYQRRQAKIKATLLKRYEVESFLQTDQCKRAKKKQQQHRRYQALLKSKLDQPLFTEEDLKTLESFSDQIYEFICLQCNRKFYSKIGINSDHAHCPHCFQNIHSKFQQSIEKLLHSYNVSFLSNDRKTISPLELDIYIPEKGLAIECDGIYYHTEESGKHRSYHLDKTLRCKALGIQLIHIFENEFVYSYNIVESRIKNLLGIYNKTVYARKCVIKEVDSKTSKEFQEQNHIQGAVNASVNLGLFFEDELVSLMTFSKTRFSKKYEWELVRFCSKLGYHVPGAAGKLLKHFERNWKPKSLVSYADRRWSQGKVYKALGFELDHVSAPNYWYWNRNVNGLKLESRVKYQKHKLKTLLTVYDPAKSEVENMRNNNFFRIFDCGNFVLFKNYHEKE